MDRFEDMVVVVTGTSEGIGRETAKQYCAEGAKVVGIARRGELQEELRKEIEADGGVFVPVVGDVTIEEQAVSAVETAVEKFGRIDILVNNAGTTDFMYHAHNISNEIWDGVLALNMSAALYTMRKAIPYMLEQGGGIIVNVGSIASVHGACAGIAYVASKHGIMGMTKSVAYNYARKGIRCNMVMPGGVDTYLCSPEVHALNDPEGFELSNIACSPGIRLADPDEIATVILMASDPEATIMNGATIAADAGFLAV